jgi:hypothetical protein
VYTKKRLNIVRTLSYPYQRLMVVLAALSMHSKQTEPNANIADSMSIWSTLRRALVAMVSSFLLLQRDNVTDNQDMDELAAKANPGADLGQFRQAGFNF